MRFDFIGGVHRFGSLQRRHLCRVNVVGRERQGEVGGSGDSGSHGQGEDGHGGDAASWGPPAADFAQKRAQRDTPAPVHEQVTSSKGYLRT